MSDDPKDLTVDTHLVDDQIAADPELAEVMRDFAAKMRQAYASVQSGQHATMDDAVRALGIEMVKVDHETGEEIEGATLQEDMGLDDGCEHEVILYHFGKKQ